MWTCFNSPVALCRKAESAKTAINFYLKLHWTIRQRTQNCWTKSKIYDSYESFKIFLEKSLFTQYSSITVMAFNHYSNANNRRFQLLFVKTLHKTMLGKAQRLSCLAMTAAILSTLQISQKNDAGYSSSRMVTI